MGFKPTDHRRRALCAALTALFALAPRAPAAAAGMVQPVAAIETAAHAYVESLLPPGSAATEITVLPLDRRLRLAPCGSSLVARLPVGGALAAHTTVAVSCDGPTHWAVYVPVVVESRIAVLVLRHAVARDSRLTADDVAVEVRRTAGTATAYLASPAELAGRTVRRPLAIGTALTVEMFSADTVIHRGQQVTLVAGGADIEIRAAGRALSDAPVRAFRSRT
jgi:flagellar basal body P-ring formation protein FlgA